MTKVACRPEGNKNGEESWWRPWYQLLATDERFDVLFIVGLLVCEFLLGCFIIERVSYTEIDWQAYMEEVDAYEAGERDYTKIRGGTGPLVYPAGFLYLFSILKAWTGQGRHVRQAQYIFLAMYLATQGTVLTIYQQCLQAAREEKKKNCSIYEIWSWRLAMGCLCLSKRLHSIFLLRLFNDGPTMLLFYISLYLFNQNRWSVGCILFSLAVSIKMNVLLFAPGLLWLLLQTSHGWKEVVLRLGLCCALPQLLIGAPFLFTYPISYLRKAFELDRVFFYQWTVNWKFLSEETFASKSLSLWLLALHVLVLLYVFVFRHSSSNLFRGQPLNPIYITRTLLLSNFIGICFARTLHYQFYAWYFHALPFLLWSASLTSSSSSPPSSRMNLILPIPVRLLCLTAVEMSFLTFPSTPLSSVILQLVHMVTLASSILQLSATNNSESFFQAGDRDHKHHIQ